jgi:4-hydroxybenzoate polyprenyltransferase
MEDTLLILLGLIVMGTTFIFPLWIMIKHWEQYNNIERILFIINYIFGMLILLGIVME